MKPPSRPEWLRAHPRFRPACFTPEEWELWRKGAMELALKRYPPQSPCEDCTPEHQAAMVTAKRCDHPDVVFKTDSHGFVCGVRPKPEATETAQQPTPTKRGRPQKK